ncbi:zf-MIZ-domain-containing protein [Mytilinidion resinicola]|uniref:Zf-MIZ-domain-containing protein n=1 Tax=Mytilinidion resinicola TaxID=574789 RepID=A0A6A6YU05_9PEZI|nr:zf-MIZ-domain-containing protein [Mytilinidion resinicola]KAF2811455.1 zf-MIZ-domain-containing protein [Mytilinidion resinicola]
MATGGSRALQDQVISLSARIKSLINADLKEICRGENLAVSGVKAGLQARIIQRLEELASTGDSAGIERLRYRVQNHGHAPPDTQPPTYQTSAAAGLNMQGQNGFGRPPGQVQPHRPSFQTRILFKQSPFYEIQDTLSSPIYLEVTPAHRTNANGHITLNEATCALLRADTNMRVMIYSASEGPLDAFSRTDISFPTQMEVKIGADEVKANFKGLKNKPGSTRPADITDQIRKVPGYRNNIQIAYALTQKRFTIIIHLVKKRSVEELTQRIQDKGVIAKETTLREMQKKANDPDLVLGSTVMSLKDPVSTLRIAIPCRSAICNHNQCFDVSSFLQLQEQAPTWTCPQCNKVVTFESLAVDQYFQEILQSVPRSTDQVTIEPDGSWSQGSNTENQTPRNGTVAKYEDDSDDLIEISDYRVNNLKTEAASTPLSLARTPPMSSREASTALSAPRSSHKRTSDVIDLTLSDDDEPRPAKKTSR